MLKRLSKLRRARATKGKNGTLKLIRNPISYLEHRGLRDFPRGEIVVGIKEETPEKGKKKNDEGKGRTISQLALIFQLASMT